MMQRKTKQGKAPWSNSSPLPSQQHDRPDRTLQEQADAIVAQAFAFNVQVASQKLL